MPERASSLAQCQPAAGLSHRSVMVLQYHAWPERYAQMAERLAAHCGVAAAPAPGKAVSAPVASLLRTHPQRLWLVAERGSAQDYPQINADIGTTLDLSHARTIIHVDNGIAVPLLSRFITVDLRPHRLAVDDVALTPVHRVGVVLWRRPSGIDILAPRSFARALWDVLTETAGRLDTRS